MRTSIFLSTAALALAVAVSAAPPEGKGGGKGGGGGDDGTDPLQTFDPEIAYREISKRNGQRLWLTDLDTTFQVEVAQSQSPIVGFDLSSEQWKLIAYDIDGTVYLRGWETGPFKLSAPDILFPSSMNVGNLDFSRDDTKLAWNVVTSGGPDSIYVHDFTTGATLLQPLSGYQVAHVRFSPADDSIYFTGSDDPVSGHDGLYRYVLGSSVATKLIDRLPGNYYDTVFDVSRPGGAGPALIVMNDQNQTPRFFSLGGTKTSKDFVGEGEKYTFNCSNTALLYLETGIRKGGLAVTPFGGQIEVLDIPWDKHSDWMRRAPCD